MRFLVPLLLIALVVPTLAQTVLLYEEDFSENTIPAQTFFAGQQVLTYGSELPALSPDESFCLQFNIGTIGSIPFAIQTYHDLEYYKNIQTQMFLGVYHEGGTVTFDVKKGQINYQKETSNSIPTEPGYKVISMTRSTIKNIDSMVAFSSQSFFIQCTQELGTSNRIETFSFTNTTSFSISETGTGKTLCPTADAVSLATCYCDLRYAFGSVQHQQCQFLVQNSAIPSEGLQMSVDDVSIEAETKEVTTAVEPAQNKRDLPPTKKLVGTYNILGEEVAPDTHGQLLLLQYEDGSIERVFRE